MKILKRKKKLNSLADILAQTTTTSSTGGTLTLEMLEKAYEAAKNIPQPIGMEFRWNLAFRKTFPFVRLMRAGRWVYKR